MFVRQAGNPAHLFREIRKKVRHGEADVENRAAPARAVEVQVCDNGYKSPDESSHFWLVYFVPQLDTDFKEGLCLICLKRWG